MHEKPKFYLSTPIYYPSDKLHIGHAYCTVAADTMCRFKRMTGYDVFFLTGSDEHGQKIAQKAEAAGVTPKAYVDNIVAGIKDLWKLMDISYDKYIRTTDQEHVRGVQQIFNQLYEQGDIYKSEYEGWYCTPCESFWTETQLVDGMCPDCGRPVQRMREESYFFRTSKYQDFMIDYIENHPEFIQPPSRANEMLANFLRPGLEDLCVSRTSIKWGIPVTFDPKHVVYVWLDALSNYITALGYGGEDTTLFDKYWPCDIHLVGKEIVRFHTIIWPIMLKALGLPLPKQVFGHGWLVLEGGKMSKSKGNVVDPVVLCNRYGVDAIRYFLMREMPFGADGVFSNEALLGRINADLANDLGNLVSRTVAMVEKYFGGVVPACGALQDVDLALRAQAEALHEKVEQHMDALQFSTALADIWAFIGECNRYIDKTMPWVLAKDDANQARLGSVMYHLVEGIRIISVMISPVMTSTPRRIWEQIGLEEGALTTYESVCAFGGYPAGTRVHKGAALFPRIDVAKEIDALDALTGLHSKQDVGAAPAEQKPEPPKEKQEKAQDAAGLISIDTFFQSKLRVARVLACEKVEKSNKLLKFSLDLGGGETRTVVSGIAKYYAPEDLIGKNLVLVSNLKPAKLCGILSEGMLLSAEASDGTLSLLTVDRDVAPGSQIG
nr:methionine--tRNA ligase [Maliibacterium massiliense]